MKKLASMVAFGLLLAACAQPPPPQAPQGAAPPATGCCPPPGGPGSGCPCGHACPAMAHEHPGGGPMMMMGHPGPSMHAEHEHHVERYHHRGPMGPGDREVMRELGMLGVRFYPPPLLIQLAGEIGLTPDQVAKIRQEVLGAQARSVDLRTKIEKAKVESTRLLAADKVDERAVDAQIDEASKAGAELRKLQVGMMLRVRDLLTPEQRKKLEERKPPRPGVQPGAEPGKQAMDEDDDDDDGDDDGDGG